VADAIADVSVLTQYIVDMLSADPSLGGLLTTPLQDVWYGDEALIPRFPTVTVESSGITSILSGAPYRTDNDIRIILIVYASKVQPGETTRKEADQLAYSVRSKLHTDRTLGGLVIHGFVSSIEYGYTVRRTTGATAALIRAARLTWDGKNKLMLGGV